MKISSMDRISLQLGLYRNQTLGAISSIGSSSGKTKGTGLSGEFLSQVMDSKLMTPRLLRQVENKFSEENTSTVTAKKPTDFVSIQDQLLEKSRKANAKVILPQN